MAPSGTSGSTSVSPEYLNTDKAEENDLKMNFVMLIERPLKRKSKIPLNFQKTITIHYTKRIKRKKDIIQQEPKNQLK